MADTTIRLKALDGTWETCGVDRVPAVVPESVVLDADDWGSKGARFDLKRDPSQVWPDIGAFTPVKIDVDGSLVWSGRVSETPSRDGTDMVMSVACEGRQHELDDDLYERKHVHANLTEWKDQRSHPATKLGSVTGGFIQGTDVTVGQGQIVLGWPKDMSVVQDRAAGVVLDLGPSTVASRMTIVWTATATDTNTNFYVRGTPDGNPTGATYSDALATSFTPGPNTSSLSFGTAYRYVHIFAYRGGVTATAGADLSAAISKMIVYSDAAYESGDASNLKASTVIGDALDRACPLLSTDRSGITATSFNIPEFAPGEPLTARDAWQAPNAFHGWMSKIDVDGRPIFQPVPSRPKYQIGEWSAATIDDSSQNSGQDIFNKVIVTGTDPAGQPVRVTRRSGQAVGAAVTRQGVPTLANPSFDVDTSGWSATGTSWVLSRNTTDYGSSPASLLGSRNLSAGNSLSWTIAADWSGTFVKNRVYVLTFWGQPGAPGGATLTIGAQKIAVFPESDGAYHQYSISWVPTQDMTNPAMTFAGYVASQSFLQLVRVRLDTFLMVRAESTLLDRRGFQRTKQLAVNSTLATDGVAAAQIGDTWLANHITTPFKGSVVLTGPNALRNRLTGQPVPLAALLRDTGELLELTDRNDPDNGATTRKGRITTVSYVPALDQVTMALDSTRSNLDNLLNRLAASGGQ